MARTSKENEGALLSGKKAKVEILTLMTNPTVDFVKMIDERGSELRDKKMTVIGLMNEVVYTNGNVWKPGEIHEMPLELAEEWAKKTYKATNPLFGEIKPGLTHTADQVKRPELHYLRILEVI